eukprot:COSAG02_NODE_1061_length_14864_cov_7.878090_2_plen_41_part_00
MVTAMKKRKKWLSSERHPIAGGENLMAVNFTTDSFDESPV